MAQNASHCVRSPSQVQSEAFLQCRQVRLLSRTVAREDPAQTSCSAASQGSIRSRVHRQHSHRNLCGLERPEHLQRGPPRLRSKKQRLTSLYFGAAMRIVLVHPRMSVMGGGERVAIHSIKEALREGHEVSLATEEFDVDSFEDFFGVQGFFKNVQLLTYRPFRPIIRKAVLYQRLIYHQSRLRKIVSKRRMFDLI